MPTPKPGPDPALADVIRRYRLERKETQEDLAFGSGLRVLTLREAEGAKVDPRWSTVRAIAAALGLRLVDLAAAVEAAEAEEH